jgi:hypothetical protein
VLVRPVLGARHHQLRQRDDRLAEPADHSII